MKRTKSINLDRMRKAPKKRAFKPLAIAVAASALVACGNSREAKIYRDVEQCIQDNPTLAQECEATYQKALTESASSGPKYQSESACVADFGRDNCVPHASSSGNSWFMPAMAGYMFAQAINDRRYYSSPLYTSYSRYSPFYGQWSGTDGSLYGKRRFGAVKVDKKAFNPKPKVTRTMSRGGFGSKVSAKSSWGGRSSRGGWGG